MACGESKKIIWLEILDKWSLNFGVGSNLLIDNGSL